MRIPFVELHRGLRAAPAVPASVGKWTRSWFLIGTSLAMLCRSTGTVAQPADPADGWSRRLDGHARTLTYASSATVLGRNTRVDATFTCNPERTKMSTGVIGFQVEIHDPDTLRAFHFDDFEGPDAPSLKRQLLTATVVRASGAGQRFQASPTGWFSVRGGFVFEVSDVFYREASTARKILEELRTEAVGLTLVIVDYRDSATRIELTIPLGGTSADFRWLLDGLRQQPRS